VCTVSNIISTTTVGVLTPPPPATPISPYGGTGKGTFSGSKSVISTRLKTAFATMKKMQSGGDEYLAQELAASIGDYLRAGSVSIILDNPIVGSGTGAITIGTQKEIEVNGEL
ncbi:MAG: hypothetical protein K5907_05480, partial [Treponema sp.]|nr:hypothetical protein [Treponema sp.]